MSLVVSAVAPARRPRSVPLLLLLGTLAGGSLSCSDKGADSNTDAAGDAVSLTCPPSTDPIEPDALIDDFEDGNSTIASIGGRKGDWYSYGDSTVGGKIDPLGLSAPVAISGGRCGSRMALRLTSSGYLEWGSGVTAAINWGLDAQGMSNQRPYDASAYKGVTFFARIGDTSSPSVRFQMEDNSSRPEGGLCMIGGDPTKECYDGFGLDLPQLTTSWQEYRIAFSSLSQRNFGLQRPALDTSNLHDIQFLFPASAVTDFWVDDVKFYR